MLIPKGVKPKRIRPKRIHDEAHLAYVASQPCCVCKRHPVEVHHLLRADPKRCTGRKAGDEYTVPLCPFHHSALHQDGNETRFLQSVHGVNGPALAAKLWGESHGD